MGAIDDEAAAWLADNWRPERSLGEWWSALAESGWGFPTWPAGRFGRGLWPEEAARVTALRRRLGALAPPSGIGPNLAGPTLLAHGTGEQIDRFLPGIAHGTDIWCQLFSEPGAGSDLASVRTRAVLDGEQWRITGQKVWTTGAHRARWALLIARTDPDVPKHRGITFLVLAMDQPGVEVRPLREMTGRAVFNEVFLTDAVVPAANVIGAVHDGWRVAMTTLANERNYMGTGASSGGSRVDVPLMDLSMPVGEVLAGAEAEAGRRVPRLRGYPLVQALAVERELTGDPVVRQELARAYGYGELGRMTGVRVQAATKLGRRAGPELSVQKVATSRTLRHLGSLALGLEGPDGMLAGMDAPRGDRAFEVVCTAFVNSIGGGTDEIQRNIIGERVLGLPAEPRLDKDVPFRDQL
ncbi:MAG: acyl-CoA dehydrogenase family protein [Acidimicrobiales bacterium]|nr:acyl-CoA dehydrogenase family protein [Acidimicrobiales bacterium]